MEILTTEPRTEVGTIKATALRAAGRYPAVLVGAGRPTVQISVNAAEFDATQRRHARGFELHLEGRNTRAALQAIQFDAMGDQILHIDFMRDPEGALEHGLEEAEAAAEAAHKAAAEAAAEAARAAANAAIVAEAAAEAEGAVGDSDEDSTEPAEDAPES